MLVYREDRIGMNVDSIVRMLAGWGGCYWLSSFVAIADALSDVLAYFGDFLGDAGIFAEVEFQSGDEGF